MYMDLFILDICVLEVGALHARILNNIQQQAIRMYKQENELKRVCMCMFLEHPI